jgi:N6-adenosine-specific RNA methylase IME4
MFVDIFSTDKKYNIIYADPPWKYGGGKNGIELFARQQAEGWDCWGNEV